MIVRLEKDAAMKLSAWISLYACLTISSTCLALPDTLTCHGVDQAGKSVDAFIDRDVATMRINGNYLDIAAGERGMNNITTENFRNENGVLVYDSVMIEDDYVHINQYDACQNDFIMSAELCCRKHLDS